MDIKKMNLVNFAAILLIFCLIYAGTASADMQEGTFKMPGRTEGTGTHFEVNDSEYLNVTVDSSVNVRMVLESIPEEINMLINGTCSGSSTSDITISGLLPLTTYHKYEDSFANHASFTANEYGEYTYTQDISNWHIIFIKPHPSTLFLSDSGWSDPNVGTWNATTKTGTLTQDTPELIEIASNGVTLDGNGHTTGPIYIYAKTQTTVKNANVAGGSIHLVGSYDNDIIDSTISSSYYGAYIEFGSNNNDVIRVNSTHTRFPIYLHYSINNRLTNNTADCIGTPENNFNVGIYLENEVDNTLLSNNEASLCQYGIFIMQSTDITMTGNRMNGNQMAFTLDAINEQEFNPNIDTTNLIDGRPIYFMKNAQNTIYDSSTDASMFFCLNCNNITVRDLNISKTETGIWLYKTHNSLIENVTLSENSHAMRWFFSENNTITGNAFNKNDMPYQTIDAFFSNNNTFENNALTDSGAIYLLSCNYTNIVNNSIKLNRQYFHKGIETDRAYNNTIAKNTISNVSTGIELTDHSNNNIIEDNTIANSDMGIELTQSSDNRVHGNLISANNYGIRTVTPNPDVIEPYNRLYNNTISFNGYGIDAWEFSSTYYQNNIYGNTHPFSYRHRSTEIYDNNWLYEGIGNYYDTFDEPSEGCMDTNNNGLCDSGYVPIPGGALKFALTKPWGGSLPDDVVSGTNVNVNFVEEKMNFTYDNVASSGRTIVTASSEGPEVPSGFNLSSTYYEIKTTATFTDNVTVCINYNESQIEDESALKLFHYENNEWVNVTVSLDTVANVICGKVSGFSDFAVMQLYNYPPAANAGGPYSTFEGSTVIFNASGSSDFEGSSLTYRWDFENDGTWDTDWSSVPTAEHTWNDDWTGSAKAEVSDGKKTSYAFASVSVINAAPAAEAGNDKTADEGEIVSFAGTFTDAGTQDTHTYLWDFGDGTSSSSLNAMHAYADNGMYTATLTVTDDDGGFSSDTLTMTVNNVAPVVDAGSDKTANEGSAVSLFGTFTDAGISDTHTIEWNFGDGTAFVTGTLSPSHTYTDNGIYIVTLNVTDDDGASSSDTLQVTVNNVAPVVNAGADQIANEGESVSFSGSFTDAGTIDTHTYLWDFGDGTAFVTGTLTPSHTYTDNGIYTVTLTVTDNDGASSNDALLVTVSNVAPIVDAGSDQTVNEGDIANFSGNFNDAGSGDTHTIEWDFGDGTGTATGTLAPTYTYADYGNYTVTLNVTDDDGASTTDTLTVTVLLSNVPPVTDAINASIEPILIDTSIYASANFTDENINDVHTAVWEWGDNTTSSGSVTEANGVGHVTGTHTYNSTGVYTVKLNVTDGDGATNQSVFRYVVIYDPDGGFVTGGGWINSTAGAYIPDPTLTGKAKFGFVSKYKKGATIPSGQTEFKFKVADLHFRSETYEWLVVSGPKAKYKGNGSINNNEGYGFMLTATDGQANGGGGVDKFRMKIWNLATEQIVYDNQLGSPDDADATTAIDAGNIIVHKK